MKNERTEEKNKKRITILFILFLVICFIVNLQISSFGSLKDVGIEKKQPDIIEIDDTNTEPKQDDIGNNNENEINGNRSNNYRDRSNIRSNNRYSNSINTDVPDSKNSSFNIETDNKNDANDENTIDNDISIDNDSEDKNEVVVKWGINKKVDIFSNKYFDDKSIIAPGVSSDYQFAILNKYGNDVKYNITFNEENNFNINMKYRLKKDNIYVIGGENSWVSADDLNINDIFIAKDATHIYVLQWKWFDSDNDTEIGKNPNASYSLKIQVRAEEV